MPSGEVSAGEQEPAVHPDGVGAGDKVIDGDWGEGQFCLHEVKSRIRSATEYTEVTEKEVKRNETMREEKNSG
jgi:hypothetical protein